MVLMAVTALVVAAAAARVYFAAQVIDEVKEGVKAEYHQLTNGIDKRSLGRDAASGIKDIGSAAKERALLILENDK